jgi:hypothetical protein
MIPVADGDVLITPERKKIRREPTALTGLHGAAIAYPTLRTYVISRRATAKTPGSKVPASREVRGGT